MAVKQKTKMEKTDSNRARDRNPSSITTSKSFLLHSICALGLAIAFWVSQNVYSINLISDPVQTLRLIWVVETPILILLYSFLRRNPEKCSFLKAVGRGFIGLITGAVLMAFGAVILGAPIGIQYLTKTFHWSLLISLFTFVPAACVFGSSWIDWQRLFANTRPVGTIDYMICIPAHGAVIGAWLGAWPMPLDWERPWQEWPVCVSYGAVAGYLVGIVASLGFVLVLGDRRHHVKGE